MNYASRMEMHFLGVGGSGGPELGSASAVLEVARKPMLLIDCGHEIPLCYTKHYGELPSAVFITHAHMDHVGGLESLFFSAWQARQSGCSRLIRLFVPSPVVPLVHQRAATMESPLAEGGVNFWDMFQLQPVSKGFWLHDLWFNVFPVRHGQPDFAFGLQLDGKFVFTGDTRPIPETLARFAINEERVFHDGRPDGNAAHAGWDELRREYPESLLERLVIYHYGTQKDALLLQTAGATIAARGQRFDLGSVQQCSTAAASRVA